MTQDEELAQLRAERTVWRDIAREKHQETLQRKQKKQIMCEALKEAMQAIEGLQTHTNDLKRQIDVRQERVKTFERQVAEDSHKSSLPPSSDRFVRPVKSLRQKSGKRPGGQPGHQGHHLKQAETPDVVVIHVVEQCERCQHDLADSPADLPERRQVVDVPVKRLWVTEHRVEEKQCPACFHLTRVSFPSSLNAPVR